MTQQQFEAYASHVRAISARVTASIDKRARQTAQDAGLSPDIAYLHAHNAIVSFDNGKPWPEVNYSLARKVQYLEQLGYQPGRLADAIIGRAIKRVTWGANA